MLDGREIDIEIARLEYMESSYANYSKLADLYTIRNQMSSRPSSAPSGNSDFLRLAAEKDGDGVWDIINELMETLQVSNPRVYNSVMRKISGL